MLVAVQTAGRHSLPQRGWRGLDRVFAQVDSSTAASQLPSEFPTRDWRGLTGPGLPNPAAGWSLPDTVRAAVYLALQ